MATGVQLVQSVRMALRRCCNAFALSRFFILMNRCISRRAISLNDSIAHVIQLQKKGISQHFESIHRFKTVMSSNPKGSLENRKRA